ncbi:hypothetical protein DFH07DRAFT_1056542 [Mycena maculata]|uniref:Zn(2)-C6 fungal-type domain-containing protein n=1 Tax=Mycena maculata TaxID=230809 RepID=A0AAD7NVG6_9AGAR|nr:hypothetical protein DFH07DRAFT_1056542 [Mycena maculata]
MSTSRMPEKKAKKPPACDTCKARRVLCHPQPNGAPCPRCIEKNIICTTTPIPRGRPRKVPMASSSLAISQRAPSLKIHPGPVFENVGECPDLNPDFVSHCFECLQFIPQYNHPLVMSSGIKTVMQGVGFRLDLLPTESRVLALSIIAFSSLVAYHESVLGEGPRPQSFLDYAFISSPDLVSCGVRRAPACRALRAVAFKAAWEAGIMLQPSIENAASCYLLDLIEQTDICGPSRPWASAYMSHVRSMAPTLRCDNFTPSEAGRWAGFYMSEALLSTRSRTPMLFTLNDQLLLSGPEPPPLEDLLSSLEASASRPGLSVLWTSICPFMFRISCLARQLSDTINGDYARVNPLSEAAAIRFLSALSLLHSIVCLLLDRVDAAITAAAADRLPFHLVGSDTQAMARTSAYGIGLSFASLVLPFYRELAQRAIPDERARGRIQVLCVQARQMALLAAHELARALRYLPALHYMPLLAAMIISWAEFCVEEVEADGGRAYITPDMAKDLETLLGELKLVGYSLEALSQPAGVALIARLESYVGASQAGSVPGPEAFDPAMLADMFFPLEGVWIEPPADGAQIRDADPSLDMSAASTYGMICFVLSQYYHLCVDTFSGGHSYRLGFPAVILAQHPST